MQGFRDYEAEDRGADRKRRYVCERCKLIILRRDNVHQEGRRVLCCSCWNKERTCQPA